MPRTGAGTSLSTQIVAQTPELVCPSSGDQQSSCRAFLSTLFAAFDTNGLRYCVLHSWDELPERIASDLDIALHPDDFTSLPLVLKHLRESGYVPVQALNYLVGAHYFVFVWFDGFTVHSAAVDIITEHRRGGLKAPSVYSLVAGRRRQGLFWIPAPESEFLYLLAKKVWKRAASPAQECRLQTLVEQLGRPRAEELAGQIFLGQMNRRVVEACVSRNLGALLAHTRAQTWKTSLARNPLGVIAYASSEALRCFRRLKQPTGLLIAVLGPDGSGKSTLVEQLIHSSRRAFRRTRVFHWRPALLWRRAATGDTTQPHARPCRSAAASIARLCAFLFDYWAGYAVLIAPRLARSGLIIFDRYFDDILIDPLRYRYGGPAWIARMLARVAPRPDLFLILDSPEHVIASRKQELTSEELQGQRQLYLEYAGRQARARTIDGSRQLADVTMQAARTVFEFLANRFDRRHPTWAARA